MGVCVGGRAEVAHEVADDALRTRSSISPALQLKMWSFLGHGLGYKSIVEHDSNATPFMSRRAPDMSAHVPRDDMPRASNEVTGLVTKESEQTMV